MNYEKKNEHPDPAFYAFGLHNVNYFGIGGFKDEWED
jgi:hypothetical protein